MGFDTVLVANRGEIARRIMRTARRMGYRTVAVYSDADRDAAHVREADLSVRLGPSEPAASYLSVERLLAAARQTGAGAIHPGYGFLSENADFARATEEAGLVFVGPSPETIALMGSKIAAKTLMAEHGVPIIPGFAGVDADDATLRREALALGFPVLLKASAGGGGKGMRVVREAGALDAAIGAARREARGAFGDDALLVERYIERPRHIEVQILGDAHGGLVHLFERECSIQRRHQKIIEETPSPGLTPELRAAVIDAALSAGRALSYRSAGTVEMVLAPDGGFYFLEVNTRLQVEHPVTELVCGLDLVELQLRVAAGEALPVSQEAIVSTGHAIECRLYAEDPDEGFLPSAGRLELFHVPEVEGLRVDTGVESGSEVSVFYDPLLAKIIAHGATRAEATRRLLRALRGTAALGVQTNRALLCRVLEHDKWASGELHTHFIEEHTAQLLGPPDEGTSRRAAIALTLDRAQRRAEARTLLPGLAPAWRNNRWRNVEATWRAGEAEIEVRYRLLGEGRAEVEVAGEPSSVTFGEVTDAGRVVAIEGIGRCYRITGEGEQVWVHDGQDEVALRAVPRFPDAVADTEGGGCVAPMPGRVLAVLVEAGQEVDAGDPLAIVEAMKMEHTLSASAPSRVTAVEVAVGQQVASGQALVLLEPLGQEPAEAAD